MTETVRLIDKDANAGCVTVIGNSSSGYPAYDEDKQSIREELVENFNSFIYFGSVWQGSAVF